MRSSKKSASKRRSVAVARSELRAGLLWARGPHCFACPMTPVGSVPPRAWTDMHERLTRARGGDPTDPDNIILLCRECHKWVTEHEKAARLLGLVRGRSAKEHQRAARPWELPS